MTPSSDDWYSDEAATFGDRIEAARTAAGLTQSQLARRLAVKPVTLRAWEEDLSEPRANKLQMMAEVLGVSLTWLLSGKGEGVAPPEDPAAEGAVDPEPAFFVALQELRDIRSQMTGMADRLALLEKRLKSSLKDPAQ